MPVDRRSPARFRHGAGRTVIRRGVPLAPTAFESQPRERVVALGDCIRQEYSLRLDQCGWAIGVVTSEAFGSAATHVQRGAVIAGVGTGGRIHHWVGAVMLELVRVPGSLLSPLVLRIPDADRLDSERL